MVNQRDEASPLGLKVLDVPSLTPEGGTVLLGVLLADMTGTMLTLEEFNGGSPASYYPAAFVNEVLRCVRVCMRALCFCARFGLLLGPMVERQRKRKWTHV